MNRITFDRLMAFLTAPALTKVQIIPHIRPDDDCVGSALALQYILRKLGKEALITCDDKLSARTCRVFNVNPLLDVPALTDEFAEQGIKLAVDCADPKLTGKYQNETYALVIDHHISNKLYGAQNYIDPAAAATGEIIYRISEAAGIPLTPELAAMLYCSISADCGSFKFSNTTPGTMRIAANLIATGIDFPQLCRRMYEEKTMPQLKAEQFALSQLKTYENGRIALLGITRRMMTDNNLSEDDLENLSDIPRKILGVEVAITLKQTRDTDTETYKLSFRSNSNANVSELASRFNGGGHAKSAGGLIEGVLEDCVERLVAECAGILC